MLYTVKLLYSKTFIYLQNNAVLENITVPNVHLNCEDGTCSEKQCEFFAGDWRLLQTALEDKKCMYV